MGAGDMMRRVLALAPVMVLATAVAEIAVFVAVVHAVGAGWAVLALAASCLAGLVLLRREGVRGWRRFRAAAESGRPPGPQVSDGLVGLLGALLLAVPGFVTAVLGVLLVTPPVRGLARRSVERATERRVNAAMAGDLFGPRRVRVRRGDPVAEPADVRVPAGPGPAIEGEIVPASPLTDR
jgi:UPF0716 protein FxsA